MLARYRGAEFVEELHQPLDIEEAAVCVAPVALVSDEDELEDDGRRGARQFFAQLG